MQNKRQRSTSPPVKATSKVVVSAERVYYVWGEPALDPPTDCIEIQLHRMTWVWDQPPVLTDAVTTPASNTVAAEAAKDATFRRGAGFNAAISWSLNDTGLLRICFGTTPQALDVISMRPEVTAGFAKANGHVPPINSVIP